MGVLLCILTYVVTSGGTKKIASLFSKLVPFMSVLYILMGLGMIIININRVPGVFTAIVTAVLPAAQSARLSVWVWRVPYTPMRLDGVLLQ